jgi:hypothetical protein
MGLRNEAFFYFKKQGRRIVRGMLPPSPNQVGLPMELMGGPELMGQNF